MRERFRQAVLQAQWAGGAPDARACPWCGAYYDAGNHAPDCIVLAALADQPKADWLCPTCGKDHAEVQEEVRRLQVEAIDWAARESSSHTEIMRLKALVGGK